MHVLSSAQGNVSFLTEGVERRLSQVIRSANRRFATYRRSFERRGVRVDLLSDNELVSAILDIAPLIKSDYRSLQQESFEQQSSRPFVIDTSSGSTSKPLLKFTSLEDERAELDAVVRAFRLLDLNDSDRVVCLDVGASEIYLFYGKALRELGVLQTCFVGVTPDYELAIGSIARLNPTVIISVPSVLRHLLDCPTVLHQSVRASPLGKAIYIGEPMDAYLRERIRAEWDVESFSFYGTTEVGSVGIECQERTGIHIPLELFVPTLFPWPGETQVKRPGKTTHEGAIAWTSSRIQTQPVIMYAVNDFVQIDVAPCPCGISSPRMRFLHRTDDTFSLFGLTFTYDLFHDALQRALGAPTSLELSLERGAIQKHDQQVNRLTLTIPHSLSPHEPSLLDIILKIYPLASFVSCGFLEIAFRYVRNQYFHRRKTRRVLILNDHKTQIPRPARGPHD